MTDWARKGRAARAISGALLAAALAGCHASTTAAQKVEPQPAAKAAPGCGAPAGQDAGPPAPSWGMRPCVESEESEEGADAGR